MLSEEATHPHHRDTVMDVDTQNKDGALMNPQPLLQFIRALAAILGLISIIIGLTYATRMFSLGLETLRSPEIFQVHLDKWAEAVGGEDLNVMIEGTTLDVARGVALLILGGGATILAWISLAFISIGAKTVSWTLSDHEAIKKMLIHAFGVARTKG